MGRKPIFKKPMTPTQLQRRWRRNVKRKALAAKQLSRGQAELRPLALKAAAAVGNKT
jgi:hypothetical protein